MLTHYLEWIFNPMRYTGTLYFPLFLSSYQCDKKYIKRNIAREANRKEAPSSHI